MARSHSIRQRFERVVSERWQMIWHGASNAEVRARWRIAPEVDPPTLPLAELNPGNGDWFEQNKALDLFTQLRHGPVHFTPEASLARIGRSRISRM